MYWYVNRANEIPRLRAEYLPRLLYEESDGYKAISYL
jgi:hypothetical protein